MSNSHLFLKSTFLKTPSQNGVGRYVCQLQRIVLKFCKNNGSSRGLRDFIENDLINFAKEHPEVVVYLKPRRHRSPALVAEYLNGEKQYVGARNFNREEVLKWMDVLRTQAANATGVRFRKMWHTDVPSIQGPWTPYLFREPSMNTIQFPNEELSRANVRGKSATEELLEIFKNQQDIKELNEKRAE